IVGHGMASRPGGRAARKRGRSSLRISIALHSKLDCAREPTSGLHDHRWLAEDRRVGRAGHADGAAGVPPWARGARAVTVLTGAGISTDSGIPDFRGPQGLWTKNPGAEKMATLQHYAADPEVRRRAWRTRVESPMHDREPNDGHRALVTLERRGILDTLVTQNVDGLHLKAGSSPERVIEIHGTTREVVCLDCGERAPMERALARVRAGEADPPCRTGGGILKSATISFGQGLVQADLERAGAAARRCDLMLAVGTKL